MNLHSFAWVGCGGEKATLQAGNPDALVIRCLSGRQQYGHVGLQLDTALASSVFYRDASSHLQIAFAAAGSTAPLAKVALSGLEVSLSIVDGSITVDAATGLPIVGSIGMDALRGRVLFIDFAELEVGLADEPSALVAAPLMSQALPFDVRHGRIFVNAQIGEETTDLLFDTGSASFGVVASDALWRRLGGRWPPPDEGGLLVNEGSWGRDIRIHALSGSQPLVLGGLAWPAQSIVRISLPDGSNTLGDRSTVDGLLGLRAFRHLPWIAIDAVHGWLRFDR